MLFSTCPISGVTYYLDIGASKSRCKQIHPLMYATIPELMRIAPSSDSDYQLILCSLITKLADANLVIIPQTIPRYPVEEIKRELPHLLPFTRWAQQAINAPQFKYLPQFRLSDQLKDLTNWRQEVREIAGKWDTLLDAAEARQLKREREESLRLLTEPVNPSKPESARRLRIRSRVNYMQNALESRFSPSIVQYYVNLLLSPATFEVVNLQQAKEVFLDCLPEKTVSDWNDKHEILRILDATIVEKVGLAAIIGIGASRDELEIVQQIRKENSVFAEGKEFITSNNRKLQIWLNANNGEHPAHYEPPTYETEPKREDFKSQLGYDIAMKTWRQSNGQ